jgi:hypothetical protein
MDVIQEFLAVHRGTITEATHHDRLQQVVSHCESLGCRFYHCAIDLRHKRDADPAFIAKFLSGVAAVLPATTTCWRSNSATKSRAVTPSTPRGTLWRG